MKFLLQLKQDNFVNLLFFDYHKIFIFRYIIYDIYFFDHFDKIFDKFS